MALPTISKSREPSRRPGWSRRTTLLRRSPVEAVEAVLPNAHT